MKKHLILSAIAIFAIATGCSRKIAVSFTTTADKSKLFETAEIETCRNKLSSDQVLRLDASETHQTIDGFGAAMTWASCYNLLKMTPDDRTEFLKELFDKETGLGISLIRVTIGASDFNLEEYTWCDTPGIENFKMHESDKEIVIPILKEIYAINPDIRIIASPWSCPRWMKQQSVDDGSDFYSWTSGSLKKEYYADYATYFVKWIQAMEAEGFDIYAMTIQNEPLNHGNSMSLYMTWEEQRDFIKTALGPAFVKNGIKSKILLFDHNYDYDGVESQQSYPLNIYQDAEASKYSAGSAWHNYRGRVTELDKIVKSAPDKEIYFTEASIGTWNYDFGRCLIRDFDSIFLQTLARECKGVALWNMVLDENRWPFSPQKGSCKTCLGVATLQSDTGKIIDRTSHWYDIAHTSKVIRQGAVRIGLSGQMPEGIISQAYQNPDGSYGIVILNRGDNEQEMVFAEGKHYIKCSAPAKSIVSILW